MAGASASTTNDGNVSRTAEGGTASRPLFVSMDSDQAAFAVGPESLVSIQKQRQPLLPQSASSASEGQNPEDRVRSLYGGPFEADERLKTSKEPGNLWDDQDATNELQSAEQHRQAELKRQQRQVDMQRKQQDDPTAWPDRFQGSQGPAGVDERMNPVAAVRRWQEALFGPDTDN